MGKQIKWPEIQKWSQIFKSSDNTLPGSPVNKCLLNEVHQVLTGHKDKKGTSPAIKQLTKMRESKTNTLEGELVYQN